MSEVSVKRGDVGVVFTDTLTDANGDPIDLTDCTVSFLMSPQRGATEPVVEAVAEVLGDPQDGNVRYVTVDGDLADAGFYVQEWELVYDDGSRFTVPSDDQPSRGRKPSTAASSRSRPSSRRCSTAPTPTWSRCPRCLSPRTPTRRCGLRSST
jgi:hypothetical protein